MITNKKFEYKERDMGNGKIIPAHFECYYYWNNKVIACYESLENVVYLNSRMLDKNVNDFYSKRIQNSKYSEAFDELIEQLQINDQTKFSEFFDM